MSGLRLEFDATSGTVKLGPPKHLNLIQVAHCQGRYFLFNGYHRVVDALAAGIAELPALVVEVLNPLELQLPGNGLFNALFILGSPRPPLLSDFSTPAAMDVRVRERRYGVLIDLTVKPLVIGI